MNFQLKRTSKHFAGSRYDENFRCVTFYKAKKSNDSDEVSRRKLLDEARHFLIGELVSPPLLCTIKYDRISVSVNWWAPIMSMAWTLIRDSGESLNQDSQSESAHNEALFQLSNNEKECVEGGNARLRKTTSYLRHVKFAWGYYLRLRDKVVSR